MTLLIVFVAIVSLLAVSFWSRAARYRVHLQVAATVVALGVFLQLVVASRPEIAQPSSGHAELVVNEPSQNAEVNVTYLVRGTMTPATGQVVVLVRPMSTGEFWIQAPPVLGDDGAWETVCNFGTEQQGVGERFEIVALGYPDSAVLKGHQVYPGKKLVTLDELPPAPDRKVLRVTRLQ